MTAVQIIDDFGPEGGSEQVSTFRRALPVPVSPPFDPDAEEEGREGFNFWQVFHVLARHKWLILLTTIIGVALAVFLTSRLEPQYRATATVEVRRQEAQIIEGSTIDPLNVADSEFMATQYALLRSHTLAERVAELLGLANDERYADQEFDRAVRKDQAARTLLDRLKVAPEGRSRVIKITYESERPEEASLVANAMAENFIESALERKYDTTSYARDFLSDQLAETKAALETSERQLVRYAEDEGIIELSGRTGEDSLDANSVVTLNNELALAQSERIAAEQRFLSARDRRNSRELLESAEYQTLRATRAEMFAEYQERLGEFKPGFPAMERLQARIDALDAEIARERSNIVAALETEYEAALARESSLLGRVDQLKADIQDLRNRRIQYTILQREVDTNREQYEALLQRLKEVGVAAAVGSSQISIIDRARPPRRPFEPNMARNVAAAFVLSFGGAIGLAFALAYVDDTIKSPDDVRDKLGLAAIGVIPLAEDGEDSILEALGNPRSSISEAFFSARTALQYVSAQGLPRSVLLTSTRPAEGKSSTTASLATVLSKGGKRVLIIDADMRKPTFHAGRSSSIGLSGLLTSTQNVADHVIYSGRPNLALLPSGAVPPNPAEILSNGRLHGIMRQAEKLFDVVLVDSPPVLSIVDAPILGAVCESALVVVESGAIRRPSVLRTVERLLESRTNVIGVVLTKFDARRSGVDYGYYHYAYGDTAKAYGRGQIDSEEGRQRTIDILDFGGEEETVVADEDDEWPWLSSHRS